MFFEVQKTQFGLLCRFFNVFLPLNIHICTTGQQNVIDMCDTRHSSRHMAPGSAISLSPHTAIPPAL